MLEIGQVGMSSMQNAFKPKLIIWDLDDTLWQGTLAEGHDVVLNERRSAFVRTLNQRGIVSAICSKNDPAAARAALEGFGLWDAFVFPRIAYVPKGPAVKQLIADMQLRPANVLFIDDNVHNLNEVAHAVPDVHVMDATSAECDALLQQIADDHAQVDKSRVDDYRMLESRLGERQQQAELSDEAFLMQSGIHAAVTYHADSLQFADRVEELINRSNQLNYTASRIEAGASSELIARIMDYDTLCAFVWDKYGYYGLVGVAIFDRKSRELVHFAFSCRIMHMGVEDFLLKFLLARYPDVDLGRLHKPLPVQSSRAITAVSFAGDPAVRERVLARETQHDPSRIDMRVMADCQSGIIHHYSRFQDRMDFDNQPRFFNLPMMKTWWYASQKFPRYLVYTAALDYVAIRWTRINELLDYPTYLQSADAFCNIVIRGDHRALIILPPLDADEIHYQDPASSKPHGFEWEFGEFGNDFWLSMASRFPNHIACIDLTGLIAPEEMIDADHYQPSVFRRLAVMVDDWYAQHQGEVPDVSQSGGDFVSLQPDLSELAETSSVRG
jgi:FkbH-like protein